MKNDTLTHIKQHKIIEHNTKTALKEELQNLLEENDDDENITKILNTEQKLESINSKKLLDTLAKK